MDKSDSLHNDLDIICLTGGKCGSTTLLETFKFQGFNCIKCHSHWDFISQFGYDGLYKSIEDSSKNKKLYIIDFKNTKTRENIIFFSKYIKKIPYYKNKSIKELINIFNTEYLDNIEEYHPDLIMLEFGCESFNSFDFKKICKKRKRKFNFY